MALGGHNQRKKQGPRITPQRHDELIAAIRAAPNDLEAIATRFDLGKDVVRRYAGFAR
jgi:hypothetical protein